MPKETKDSFSDVSFMLNLRETKIKPERFLPFNPRSISLMLLQSWSLLQEAKPQCLTKPRRKFNDHRLRLGCIPIKTSLPTSPCVPALWNLALRARWQARKPGAACAVKSSPASPASHTMRRHSLYQMFVKAEANFGICLINEGLALY